MKLLSSNEPIQAGDFHSFDDGALFPIFNETTVGQTPADFPEIRKFYRPFPIGSPVLVNWGEEKDTGVIVGYQGSGYAVQLENGIVNSFFSNETELIENL